MDINDLIIVGQRKALGINLEAGILRLKHADRCRLYYMKQDRWAPFELDESVAAPTDHRGLMSIVALEPGSAAAMLEYDPGDGNEPESIRIAYTALALKMSVDADRDGVVGDAEEGGSDWVWGVGQPGAILLVNNDRDLSDFAPEGKHKSELASLMIHAPGVNPLPPGVSLRLYCTGNAARRFTVYRVVEGQPEVVLGLTRAGRTLTTSPPLEPVKQQLFVEAHEFPGPFFDGLITVELQLLKEMTGGPLVAAERGVVFRVAPWIMTPNHLPAKMVFACDMGKDPHPNKGFLKDLKDALDEVGVPLHVVPRVVNGGDRWIQDEMEFGYAMGPGHALPVVFDSPRDRKLDGFPEAKLLGPDFGHFQIGGSQTNSLDSFGNLEVSPPVVVDKRKYPLGRIVFGGREHRNYGVGSREMMPEIRRFLYAQKVQSPIEINTDWLAVGHVDEIVCFVPAESEVGFRVLMASPRDTRGLLERLRKRGHADAVLFPGRTRLHTNMSAERTVGDLLDDGPFWAANAVFQEYQDANREILKEALGIGYADFVDIPVAFYPPSTQRTLAYFPDMVNHLVLGKWSLVPKPYGPMVGGEDQFEKAFRDAVPKRKVRFIEDWYSYHELSGEVHCGTNCLREPPGFNWWDHKPDGVYDL